MCNKVMKGSQRDALLLMCQLRTENTREYELNIVYDSFSLVQIFPR